MNSINSNAIVVTGLGMVSSLGRDVVTGCAASRAGISNEAEIDYFRIFDEETADLSSVVGHSVVGLTEGYVGLGRLVRLGSSALDDLLDYANIGKTDFSRTGFFINVTDGFMLTQYEKNERLQMKMPELNQNDENYEPYEIQVKKYTYGKYLIPRITQFCNISVNAKFSKVFFENHTGVISAIKKAIPHLVSGEIDRFIIGGIDSLVDPEIIEILSGLSVLKSPDNPAGFIPSEAGAFFLIETYQNAKARNAKIEGQIESLSIKQEKISRKTDQIHNGIVLSDLILEVIKEVSLTKEQDILSISDINGDPWRASEISDVITRVFNKLGINYHKSWSPAMSFGEVGAATGAVSICVAIRGFTRNYINDDVLISLSDEEGSKGAIYLKSCRV